MTLFFFNFRLWTCPTPAEAVEIHVSYIPSEILASPMSKNIGNGDDCNSEAKKNSHNNGINSSPNQIIEHHKVGVSLAYWSFVPLTIRDVCRLSLVQGLDCLSSHPSSTQFKIDADELPLQNSCNNQVFEEAMGEDRELIIPISKCKLLGTVVGLDHKTNKTIFLLDDGTGLIDCIRWNPKVNFVEISSGSALTNYDIKLGDSVFVLGKVRSISRTLDKEIIREIHIEKIEKISSQLPNQETMHWLKCSYSGKRIRYTKSPDTPIFPPSFAEEKLSESSFLQRLQNQDDIVEKLKEEKIKLNPNALPKDGQYFKPGCKCKLFHKEMLLYCHCDAEFLKHDPNFRFRDALLNVLLKMESDVKTEQPLLFLFKTLKEDDTLLSEGKRVLGDDKYIYSHLLLPTVAKLRRDGIIFLEDESRDEYLLISRKVLNQVAKGFKSFTYNRQNLPLFLSNDNVKVHRRFKFVLNELKKVHNKASR